ncbi:MAG: hypothetical protein ACTHKX_09450 [Pseudolysinimonas sp.]
MSVLVGSRSGLLTWWFFATVSRKVDTHEARHISIPLALACTILVASPAIAGTPQEVYSKTGHSRFVFADKGEVFNIFDWYRDGLASVGEYRFGSASSPTTGQLWNHFGSGTRAVFDADLKEGTVLYVRTCEGVFSTRFVRHDTCSRWARAVA